MNSFCSEEIIVGKSNFNAKALKSAISLLLIDGRPDGVILCEKVDKIYPKILEQNISKTGKIYSKEKWYISGCSGANAVIATLYPSGLVGIDKVKK